MILYQFLQKAKNIFRIILNPIAYLLQKDKIFIVYTMGKVGSSTVYQTLKKELPFSKIFHVHFLSVKWLDELLPNTNHTWNIENGYNVLDFLKLNKSRKVYIVSMIREPVSREVSNLFQNPKDYTSKPLDTLNKEELIELRHKIEFEYYLNWFSSEFTSYTGIKLDELKSPKKVGYSISRTEKFDILLIKLEKLGEIFEPAFEEFSGIKIKKIQNANKASSKSISNAYNIFKQLVVFEESQLDELYNSEMIQFFYDSDELASFKQKWLQPIE